MTWAMARIWRTKLSVLFASPQLRPVDIGAPNSVTIAREAQLPSRVWMWLRKAS
ncbi:hypothetical protein [Streptomyces sp. MP131-18]|uniref:hypothetical protein n=1 Tax=Streptomyces sp. MP131-18 TaxID=1857892 RepID=UPI0009CF39B1|nr:hypothetical protein [Streptomyces sp. MP131-18]ONK16033.1 hypothetical protein STBA_68830 [Streptomyces sp. MP131-18]